MSSNHSSGRGSKQPKARVVKPELQSPSPDSPPRFDQRSDDERGFLPENQIPNLRYETLTPRPPVPLWPETSIPQPPYQHPPTNYNVRPTIGYSSSNVSGQSILSLGAGSRFVHDGLPIINDPYPYSTSQRPEQLPPTSQRQPPVSAVGPYDTLRWNDNQDYRDPRYGQILHPAPIRSNSGSDVLNWQGGHVSPNSGGGHISGGAYTYVPVPVAQPGSQPQSRDLDLLAPYIQTYHNNNATGVRVTGEMIQAGTAPPPYFPPPPLVIPSYQPRDPRQQQGAVNFGPQRQGPQTQQPAAPTTQISRPLPQQQGTAYPKGRQQGGAGSNIQRPNAQLPKHKTNSTKEPRPLSRQPGTAPPRVQQQAGVGRNIQRPSSQVPQQIATTTQPPRPQPQIQRIAPPKGQQPPQHQIPVQGPRFILGNPSRSHPQTAAQQGPREKQTAGSSGTRRAPKSKPHWEYPPRGQMIKKGRHDPEPKRGEGSYEYYLRIRYIPPPPYPSEDKCLRVPPSPKPFEGQLRIPKTTEVRPFTAFVILLMNHLRCDLEPNTGLEGVTDLVFHRHDGLPGDRNRVQREEPRIVYYTEMELNERERRNAGFEHLPLVFGLKLEISTFRTREQDGPDEPIYDYFQVLCSVTAVDRNGDNITMTEMIKDISVKQRIQFCFGFGVKLYVDQKLCYLYTPQWDKMDFSTMLMYLRYHAKIIFDRHGIERTYPERMAMKKLFGSGWAYVRVGKPIIGYWDNEFWVSPEDQAYKAGNYMIDPEDQRTEGQLKPRKNTTTTPHKTTATRSATQDRTSQLGKKSRRKLSPKSRDLELMRSLWAEADSLNRDWIELYGSKSPTRPGGQKVGSKAPSSLVEARNRRSSAAAPVIQTPPSAPSPARVFPNLQSEQIRRGLYASGGTPTRTSQNQPGPNGPQTPGRRAPEVIDLTEDEPEVAGPSTTISRTSGAGNARFAGNLAAPSDYETRFAERIAAAREKRRAEEIAKAAERDPKRRRM